MYTTPGSYATISALRAGNHQKGGFLLRFNCLFTGRGLSFPCDAEGVVDLDALSEPARGNLARALRSVGRDYSTPQVVPAY
ncbi:hypothetical protein [uncultured Azohydromonas sp.]|jgi:hypothetical protein|uniref:hypothetical protein n=1 Tax=uncultured Azohydromonas sp. TaxID=487342 RepID=UPI00262E64DB|nr:hypothetical protein [uncultured Azohydromonas sp.]